jgi:hypothetical protein
MSQSQRAAGAVLFLTLAVLFGCDKSSGPKPVPVSGTVTLDNRPLAEGTVYFKTAATGATDALPVKDGKFEGSAEVGERRVEVTAYKTQIQDLNGMKGEIKESLVGPRFNTNSTLTASVKADGPNTFKFDVASK